MKGDYLKSTASKKWLVIGGDGLIGSRLADRLIRLGISAVTTTRRQSNAAGKLYLDLRDPSSLGKSGNRFAVAFFCVGVSGIAECESNPDACRQINVTGILALARILYAYGCRIIFLSSGAVFDGSIKDPTEDSFCCPSVEYGRQKMEAEQRLLSLSDGNGVVSVVRLSKVLAGCSGIAAYFINQLAAGHVCEALEDLRLSPISVNYTVDALITIAEVGVSGIFHISGTEEITYAELAYRLAFHMGVNPALVKPATSAGMEILFRPEHPRLGMKRTRELSGLFPEPTAHVIDMIYHRKKYEKSQ